MKVTAIVRQIVDRCYVGDSNVRVIKYLISRLKDGYRTFAALPKNKRRNLMKQAIAAHRENQKLYDKVMRGGW